MQAIIEKYLIKLQLRICSRKYTITKNTLYFKNTHFLDIATLQIGKEKTHYLHTFGPYEDDYLLGYLSIMLQGELMNIQRFLCLSALLP